MYEKLPTNKNADSIESFPVVTVIIPIRNEAAFVPHSLGAVLAQDYPNNKTEIIISDGMSTDGTPEIIRQFQAKHPNVHLVSNPGRIVPTGFNAGLRQATGDIIVRVDGHTDIAPDYVYQCVAALQRTGADNVGGKMTAVGEGAFGEAVALATSSPFGIGGARFHYLDKEAWVDTVYMGAWTHKVFEQIGLFDEELVRDQDDEFNYRLREHGGKILLCPGIKSEYTVRSTPKALWKQYYQYGIWKVRVLQKHPRQMSLRQFVPPVFVLALLLSAFIALFPVTRPLALVVPFLYLFANLAASAITAVKKGWRYFPLLPFTFVILHLSYGLGFLAGLFKFWNRWGDKVGKVPIWQNLPDH